MAARACSSPTPMNSSGSERNRPTPALRPRPRTHTRTHAHAHARNAWLLLPDDPCTAPNPWLPLMILARFQTSALSARTSDCARHAVVRPAAPLRRRCLPPSGGASVMGPEGSGGAHCAAPRPHSAAASGGRELALRARARGTGRNAREALDGGRGRAVRAAIAGDRPAARQLALSCWGGFKLAGFPLRALHGTALPPGPAVPVAQPSITPPRYERGGPGPRLLRLTSLLACKCCDLTVPASEQTCQRGALTWPMTGRVLKEGPTANGPASGLRPGDPDGPGLAWRDPTWPDLTARPGPQWRSRSMSLQSESGCQGGLAVSPDRKVLGGCSA
jgi:hypothetical protein